MLDLSAEPARRRSATSGTSTWRAPGVILAAALALILVAFASTWRSMVEVWISSTTYHHAFLVPVIAAWLVWRQRSALAAAAPRAEPLALAGVVAAVLLWLLGRAADVQLAMHLGVVCLVTASIVALLGRAVARIAWFPILFLAAMVPVGDELVPALQDVTANLAVAFLRAVDIPVFHDGIMLTTPSGRFEVAEACAGLRFLVANLVVALLFAHLALRRPWKWVLFLGLAVAVPILANGLRAFGIVAIAYLTDNEYAAGVDHLVYGWVFFTLVMLALLALGGLLADGEAPVVASNGWAPAAIASPHAGFVAALAALVVAGPAYVGLVMRPPADLPHGAVPSFLPNPSWQRVDGTPRWRPQLAGTDLSIIDSWSDGTHRVELAVGWYAFERRDAELVTWGNRMDGEGWSRNGGGGETVPGVPGAARRDRLTGGGGERQAVFWYWVDGRFVADPLTVKLLQVKDRALGRAAPAALVAVSAEGDVAQAGTSIRAFLAGADLDAYVAAIGGS